MIRRVKVSPKTCTVLGYKVKAGSPMWAGLDLSRAEPRTQSTLMLALCGQDRAPPDVHLNVPWRHPNDPDDFDCKYRVRPRMEPGKRWNGRVVRSVAFERWGGEWWLAIEVEPKSLAPPSHDAGERP